jgi:hypothetical protein
MEPDSKSDGTPLIFVFETISALSGCNLVHFQGFTKLFIKIFFFRYEDCLLTNFACMIAILFDIQMVYCASFSSYLPSHSNHLPFLCCFR